MIRRRLSVPVAVAARRADAVRLLEPDCDVILCDDGLQHYALARDIEIVVMDGMRGFGNGRRLPAGPLREPVARLDEADAVVVNGPGFERPAPSACRSSRWPSCHCATARAARCPIRGPRRHRGGRDRQPGPVLRDAARPRAPDRDAHASGPCAIHAGAGRRRAGQAGAADREGCRKMRRRGLGATRATSRCRPSSMPPRPRRWSRASRGSRPGRR